MMYSVIFHVICPWMEVSTIHLLNSLTLTDFLLVCTV